MHSGRSSTHPGQRGPSHSYRFFVNSSCEFYPCHSTGREALNCLFCYCPLYGGDCPGEPEVRLINGHEVRDCTDCRFPHEAANYDDVIRCLMQRIS